MRVLIETTGARVSVGRSVAETLAVGLADPARLVLIDLTLPDGDGLTVIQPLRAAGSGTFVALTGHADRETAERCRAAGCVDVLLKPVPARELVTKVRAWLAEADPS
jgi:DNA-binding response OmpR family regulator